MLVTVWAHIVNIINYFFTSASATSLRPKIKQGSSFLTGSPSLALASSRIVGNQSVTWFKTFFTGFSSLFVEVKINGTRTPPFELVFTSLIQNLIQGITHRSISSGQGFRQIEVSRLNFDSTIFCVLAHNLSPSDSTQKTFPNVWLPYTQNFWSQTC